MHLAVVHIVECPASEQRLIAQEASANTLTVRLYYQIVQLTSSWADVFLVAEGDASKLDAFISSLKARESLEPATGDGEVVMRGVSTLLRQWNYVLPEIPEDRARWGYAEWIAEADRETAGHAAQHRQNVASPQLQLEACGGEAELRHLGPPGIRGACYTDWKELISKRLEKLTLGCNWDDVVMAAQLSTAACRRERPESIGEPAETSKRCRGYAAHESTSAPSLSSTTLAIVAVGTQIGTMQVAAESVEQAPLAEQKEAPNTQQSGARV